MEAQISREDVGSMRPDRDCLRGKQGERRVKGRSWLCRENAHSSGLEEVGRAGKVK